MPLGLDVELPTPFGWTSVKSLEPGASLIDELGYPVRVVDVSPAYETDGFSLWFGFGKVKSPEPDGELVCGAGQRLLTTGHRRLEGWHSGKKLGPLMPSNWTNWVPAAGSGSPFAEEIAVEQVAAEGTWVEVRHGEGDVRTYLNYAIPAVFSLQLQGGRADLDPWVAGVCINFYDHERKQLKLRVKELDFYEARFRAAGYSLKIPAVDRKQVYKHVWCGLDEKLERQVGKYLSRGGIPGWIFRAPERDRMAFLAGLMDQWDFKDYKNNVRSGAWFYTTNGALGRQVCDLVRTLGYPATLRSAKQNRGGEIEASGFYVLWCPVVVPFSKPDLAMRYSHMTYRAGMQVQRFLWKIYEAREIERILVRDIVVEGCMFAAGRLLVPVRGDDHDEAA